MFWKSNGLQLYYEIIGNGIPIVMLHGYSCDNKLMQGAFEPIFKEIGENKFQRIYLDLPGMGKTKTTGKIKNADDMLGVLLKFINDVVGRENFILAGESYGGYLSRGIARAVKERILGSIFICPCVIPDFSKRKLSQFEVKERSDIDIFKKDEDFDGFCKNIVVQTPRTWERYENEIMSGIKIADSTYLDDFQKKGYSFSYNVDDMREPYSFPTVVFTGKQDDCVGFEDAFNIFKNYKNVSFFVFNKAGHNLQIDSENLFSLNMKEWLKEMLL